MILALFFTIRLRAKTILNQEITFKLIFENNFTINAPLIRACPELVEGGDVEEFNKKF